MRQLSRRGLFAKGLRTLPILGAMATLGPTVLSDATEEAPDIEASVYTLVGGESWSVTAAGDRFIIWQDGGGASRLLPNAIRTVRFIASDGKVFYGHLPQVVGGLARVIGR